LKAGDTVSFNGKRCRVKKRTLDAIWLDDDEAQTGGLEQRDQELQSPTEDRQEAAGSPQEIREQGQMG